MHVLSLTAENYKQIRAVEITPEMIAGKSLIRIEGRNEQGKTSAVEMLWTLLLSQGRITKQPLRNGAESGFIRGVFDANSVDLGTITVERKFDKDGSQSLEIKNSEGKKLEKHYGTPRSILDRFISDISVNPNEFIKMTDTERRGVLLKLTGKEDIINAINNKIDATYERRTDAWREMNRTKHIAEAESNAGLDMSLEEIPTVALLTKINGAQGIIEEQNRISKAIESTRASTESCRDEIDKLEKTIDANDAYIKKSLEERASLKVEDYTALENKMKGLEDHNVEARKVKSIKENRRASEAAQNQYVALDKEVMVYRNEAAEILRESPLPIDNIEITSDKILIGDVLFDDLATTKQIMTAVDIAVAQDPHLKVLRVEGSLFDDENLMALDAYAKEKGFQIIAEIVSSQPQGGIRIEDGQIAK